MWSFIEEEDKNSGTDAGGVVGQDETNCPKFCDNDIDWGEGTAMNGCAHKLDDGEDG